MIGLVLSAKTSGLQHMGHPYLYLQALALRLALHLPGLPVRIRLFGSSLVSEEWQV